MSKNINTPELARLCKEINPKYTMKAYREMIKTLSQAIGDSLLADGRTVKLGKLVKFQVIHKDKRIIWNGIDKRYETSPAHDFVKVIPLTDVKDVNEVMRRMSK